MAQQRDRRRYDSAVSSARREPVRTAPPSAADLTPGGRALSPTRSGLLETLRAQAQPTGLPALMAMTGLHANTVRGHLDGLAQAGLVRREPDPSSAGRRNAWVYAAVRHDADVEAVGHAGLAATLAAVIHRTSPQPTRSAREAGVEWGRRLAREGGVPAGPGERAARRQVVALFAQLGFEPQADLDATAVRLTRCPLLEAAHQFPDVVCAVHLGVAEGALAEYGATSTEGRLQPFAEPGACLLRLAEAGRVERVGAVASD